MERARDEMDGIGLSFEKKTLSESEGLWVAFEG